MAVDMFETRREAILYAFRTSRIGECIGIHRDVLPLGTDHANTDECACEPIVIEKTLGLTDAEFLRIVSEMMGH